MPSSNCSTENCQESRVSTWLVSQDCRIWKIWWWLDIVLKLSPAAAADDETGGPPLPARVLLSFLPPGAGTVRDEVPASLTVRPLIDDLCPSEPNQAPRTITAPPAGLQSRHPSPPHPQQPSPIRRRETPSKMFLLLSDAISRILLSVRVPHFDFASWGTEE